MTYVVIQYDYFEISGVANFLTNCSLEPSQVAYAKVWPIHSTALTLWSLQFSIHPHGKFTVEGIVVTSNITTYFSYFNGLVESRKGLLFAEKSLSRLYSIFYIAKKLSTAVKLKSNNINIQLDLERTKRNQIFVIEVAYMLPYP